MNDQNFNQESYTPPYVEPVSPFPPAPRLDLRAAFSSGLFLALCILMTVIAAFGSVSFTLSEGSLSYNYSVNIIPLLITIGMWITFSSAKNAEGPLKKSGLVLASGTIKALRIITWVTIIISLVCGVVTAIFALNAPEGFFAALVEEIRVILDESGAEPWAVGVFGQQFVDDFKSVEWVAISPIILVAFGIFICLTMAILTIFNITYYKKLHQFAKSLCVCAEDPDALPQAAGAVSIWLLVLGIFNILSGITGITMILGYVFVKKYFVDIES